MILGVSFSCVRGVFECAFRYIIVIFCCALFLKMLISYWFLQCFVDVGFLGQRCSHIRFSNQNALKIASKLKHILDMFLRRLGISFSVVLEVKIHGKSIKNRLKNCLGFRDQYLSILGQFCASFGGQFRDDFVTFSHFFRILGALGPILGSWRRFGIVF